MHLSKAQLVNPSILKYDILISYIKKNIEKGYPVIQSLLTPNGHNHAIVITCYDNENFQFHDPDLNKEYFVQFHDYEVFLNGHRDTLVIKRIN